MVKSTSELEVRGLSTQEAANPLKKEGYNELTMILTNRSWSCTIPEMIEAPNQALWWVLGGGIP